MTMSTDRSRPGQARPWVLGLTPLVLGAAGSAGLVAALRDRLPDLPHGTGGTGEAQTWREVVLVPVYGLTAATLIVGTYLLLSARSPARKARIGVFTWPLGALALGSTLSAVLRNLDRPGPPAGPELWWTATPVAVAGLLVLGLLALLAAGRDPLDLPDAISGPGASAPRLALAPHERAAWSRTVFSARAVANAATWIAIGTALILSQLGVYLTYWFLFLIGTSVLLAINAWARVRVDENRVAVVAPWFGRTITAVGLRHVVEARSGTLSTEFDTRGWDYGALDRDRVLGYRAARDGETLILRLADGRDFVVTVEDAGTAAALVNTVLDRRREEASDADPDRSVVERPAR